MTFRKSVTSLTNMSIMTKRIKGLDINCHYGDNMNRSGISKGEYVLLKSNVQDKDEWQDIPLPIS